MMTRFKRKVLDNLEKIRSDMGFLKGALLQRDGEIERLEKQNKDLMDRIMSIKFEDYINMTPDRWDSPKREEVDTSPLTDDNMAGEILSDEELGK